VETVRRIDAIFAIERESNGLPAAARRMRRNADVRPLVCGFET